MPAACCMATRCNRADKFRRVNRFAPLVGLALGLAKEGSVLLAELQVRAHARIKGRELAHIGLQQTNMGHGSGDGLFALLFPLALLLFFFRGFLRLLAHVKTHSAARQPLGVVLSVSVGPFSRHDSTGVLILQAREILCSKRLEKINTFSVSLDGFSCAAKACSTAFRNAWNFVAGSLQKLRLVFSWLYRLYLE